MNTYPKISLKKGREYQILRGHPWLFSGGISQAPGKVTPGSLVDLVDTNGRFVARGYYNPGTDIAVRVLTKDQQQQIDASFFKERLQAAQALRHTVIDLSTTDANRLVHAEGDFLPGYVVDYYAGVAVVQCHTAGADQLLPQFTDALISVVQPKAIVVRNDSSGRKREGLELAAPQVVQGSLDGEIVIRENNIKFAVDVVSGQKTGFFTDQREKRAALQRYCSQLPAGASMVNGFCYTGAFSVYATVRSPSLKTINIDESQRALDQARRNFELNGLDAGAHEFLALDAFPWLEEQRAAGAMHDVVILDPPAFAKSHKDKPRALKGYTRMDRLGIAVTKPGGVLVVCSCSGSVSLDEFTACLRDAAADSGRHVQILEVFLNGPDHPVSIGAPESNYLKVLFCAVN
jgi:23S rRNA (cytosine1962-C5)-methyltransferase